MCVYMFICCFPPQIDGELTLGENIADNGGLHTAFRAYTNVMNETERQTKIDGHTLDQLFFMSFAQVCFFSRIFNTLPTINIFGIL